MPGDPPFTLEDVVLMLGRLADARVADQADWDRWLRLLAAVFGDGQEEAVAALYVRATGIPDTVMFGWRVVTSRACPPLASMARPSRISSGTSGVAAILSRISSSDAGR